MNAFDDKLDITKNIKIIEMIKCELLTSVAELYSNISEPTDTNERVELFADLSILTYILANKLGINYDSLEHKIVKKLKLGILEESYIHDEISSLLRFYNK